MDNILDKVRKLLRLSESSNANEAALAAAKAQELIDRHKLDVALLAIDDAEPEDGLDSEPIMDFKKAGAPLDAQSRLERWRGALAGTIARRNGCRIYLHGSSIALVGRPSDAETVRYLYAYLTREVERLTGLQGQGMGRTWRNNFRLGVVDTIAKRMYEAAKAVEDAARQAASAEGGMALVRVDKAIARIDQRGKSVDAWIKTNLKLYSSGGGRSAHYNSSAREAGRKAGHSIALGGAKRSLTA